MKKISILLITFFLFSQAGKSQKATSSCTGITVSNIPSYPVVYFANVGYKNCSDGGGYYEGCDEGSGPACCRVIQYGSPVTPRFWLERLLADGSWSTVSGPQYSSSFPGLAHGTYRVKCQVPNIAENICGADGLGNFTRARICLFNTLGQFIGYWGTWDNSPFATSPPTYTNTVVVGATLSTEISYTFVDIPETGPESAYDYGEVVKMNTSASINYNLWWVAIFEHGSTYNRYASNGWVSGGPVPGNEFNLSTFWNSYGYQFEVFHSYDVQFVTENAACRNGIEMTPPATWNDLTRTFFICPAGSGCRIGEDAKKIILTPNPATSVVRLNNFELDADISYQASISDLSGRKVRSTILTSKEIDISDIQSGMYVLTIEREGIRFFTDKLIIK